MNGDPNVTGFSYADHSANQHDYSNLYNGNESDDLGTQVVSGMILVSERNDPDDADNKQSAEESSDPGYSIESEIRNLKGSLHDNTTGNRKRERPKSRSLHDPDEIFLSKRTDNSTSSIENTNQNRRSRDTENIMMESGKQVNKSHSLIDT